MSTLNEVKALLDVDGDALDAKLNVIITNTERRLLTKLDGEIEIPAALGYIVTEVSVARFNRIGSEGATSHSVEGESLSWGADDFAPYEGEIKEWLSAREESGKGTVRFL